MFFPELDLKTIKTIVKRFVTFGLPLIILISWGLSLLHENQMNGLLGETEKKQEELVILSKYQYEALFKNVRDDLNLILGSDEFTQYLSNPEPPELHEVQQMFLRFLSSKKSLFQLRYLSMEGQELVRAEATREGEYLLVTGPRLQNKGDRYYFESLTRVGRGELYVSDFDLNTENGEIELPYRPTIRFGMPVYHGGTRTGFLLANMDGTSLLEIFLDYAENRSSQISLGLIDKNHLISLSNLESGQGIESSFLRDGQEVTPLYDRIDPALNRGRFAYDGSNYFYSRLEQEDQDWVFRFDDRGGPWILISDYDPDILVAQDGNLYLNHPELRIGLIILIGVAAIFVLAQITFRESEHLLLLASGIISEYSHDGIMITDSNKRVIYINPIFEQIFGYPLDEVKGKKPQEFLYGKPPILINKTEDNTDLIWEGNVWDISADKVHIQRYLRLRVVRSSDGRVAYFVGIYSEPKLAGRQDEDGMEKSPNAMLNRESLNYLVPQFYLDKKSPHDHWAMIILRMTEYTILRTKMTEREENTLISTIASAIKRVLNRESMIFAPSMGLVFIAVSVTAEDPIENVMDRIDKAVSSVRFSDPSCSVQYLSGVAISPDHGTTSQQLIENAYIALEAITKLKTVKYLLFNQDVYETVNQHLRIKNEIDNAYDKDEFSVVYQPQNDAVTGELTGVEALVRWNSLRLGPIPPYHFIPVMEEEPTQIKRLGIHMLGKVISECKQVLPLVSEKFRVSVNLSAQEFADSALMTNLIRTLNDNRFPSRNICFEITETVLSANLNQTNDVIKLLHRNGITVAMDDFGTGYSSLGYLKQLETDKLKIDRAFIKDFPEKDDGSILKAITKLAQEIGLKIIVEGIETEEQLSFISALGCQEYQGYISSKPVPLGTLKELIQRGTWDNKETRPV